MRHARASIIAGLVALALSGSASVLAQDTAAIALIPAPPLPQSPRLAYPGEPIPGNGSVLIITDDGLAPIVTVTSPLSPDMPIEGTVAMLWTYFVWTPAASLLPGTYDVTLDYDPAYTSGQSFAAYETLTVTSSVELDGPDALDATLELSSREIALESACCFTEMDGINVGQTCVSTVLSTMAHVGVGLQSQLPREVTNQYLFKIVPVVADAADAVAENEYPFPLDTPRGVVFMKQAAEYCFQINAIEIGSQTAYDDVLVEPSCVAHGTLPQVGNVVVDVGDAFLDHTACIMPPESLQERWCALNEAECTASDAPASCDWYGNQCLGEPPPRENLPMGGAGGAAGSGGAGSGAGAGGAAGWEGAGAGGASGLGSGGAGGAAGMSPPIGDPVHEGVEPKSKHAKWCSTMRPHASSAQAPWAIALLVLVFGVSRPYRRRRSRAAR